MELEQASMFNHQQPLCMTCALRTHGRCARGENYEPGKLQGLDLQGLEDCKGWITGSPYARSAPCAHNRLWDLGMQQTVGRPRIFVQDTLLNSDLSCTLPRCQVPQTLLQLKSNTRP
eukprot:1159420-Pelagomonas_calceolata.AAC.8